MFSSSEEEQLVEEVTEVCEDIRDKFPSGRSQDNAQRVERSYFTLTAGQGLGWHQAAASRPSLFLKCLEAAQGVGMASSQQSCMGCASPCRGTAGVRAIPKGADGDGKGGSCAGGGDARQGSSGSTCRAGICTEALVPSCSLACLRNLHVSLPSA